MGMRLSSRGKGKKYRPVSEINVTPFVDVMLVLLVIFMVTAPLLAVGVPVELPKTVTSCPVLIVPLNTRPNAIKREKSFVGTIFDT